MADKFADPIRVGPVRTPHAVSGRGARLHLSSLLRIFLPLGAVALVAALFFGGSLVGPNETSDSFWPEGPARGQGSLGVGVSARGVTPDGYEYTVAAAEARPDGLNGTRLDLAGFSGQMALEGGRVVSLDAPTGLFEQIDARAELGGGVEVTTSDGYRVRTERLVANTDALTAESRGRVLGYGPAGRICADQMMLSDADGGVAHFQGDVVVVLTDLPGAGGADGTSVLTPPPRDPGEETTACQDAVWAADF